MAKVAEFDRQDIFDEIDVEREYQDKLWDNHVLGMSGWLACITHYSSKWFDTHFPPDSDIIREQFRKSMLKTAALAVSAIEQTDRVMKGRNVNG